MTKTIGATELRKNLDAIFDQINAGQEIIVTHRFKGSFRLQPLVAQPPHRAKLSGLRAYQKVVKKPLPYDPEKSIKELYAESMKKKHGI